MPGAWCCVPFCHNEGGHRFPKDSELRQLWVAAVQRDDWEPSNHSIVCYKHFKDTDYIFSTKNGYKPLRRKLRKGSVPSIFMSTELLQEQELNKKSKNYKHKNNSEILKKAQESDIVWNLVPASWLPPLQADGADQFDENEVKLKDDCSSPYESAKASSSDTEWHLSDASDQGSSYSRLQEAMKPSGAIPVDISSSLTQEHISENLQSDACPELKFFQSMMPQLRKLPPLELLKLKSRFVHYLIQELQENNNLK